MTDGLNQAARLLRELKDARLRVADLEEALERLKSSSRKPFEFSKDPILTNELSANALIENMLSGLAYCRMHVDADGTPVDFTYLLVNTAFERLTGLKNVAGKKVTEVIPGIKETDRELLDIYGRVASTGKPEQFERYVGALGDWYLVSAYCPAPGYFIATFDVTTERKRTEERLQERDLRLRNHLGNSPLAIIEWDKDYIVTEWSGAAESIFGWSRTDVIGKPIMDLNMIFEADIPKVQDVMTQMSSGSAKYVVSSNRNYTKDRRVLDCEWYNSVLRDSQGKLTSVMSQVQNITDRRRAEEANRENREKLERALASMTDAVFISDLQGNFVNFNEAFATYHRFKSLSECGRKLSDLQQILDVFMPDGTLVPLDMWVVPRALRGETVTNAEYTLRLKQTGETWVGIYNFSPIWGESGKIVGSVVVGREITAQKKAEADRERLLAETKRQAMELDAVLDVLPFMVSIHSLDGAYQRVNPAVMEIFGFNPCHASRQEVALRVQAHFPDGTPLTPLNMPSSRALQGEAVSNVEYVIVDGKGKEHDVVIHAIPLRFDGKLCGAVLAHVDITDRKNAERELVRSRDELEIRVRERTAELARSNQDLKAEIEHRRKSEELIRSSEEKFRTVFNTSLDPIFLLDRETLDILDINAAACATYGFERDEFLRLKVTDISAEADVSAASIRQGVNQVPLRYHRKKSGSAFPVEIKSAPFTLNGRRLTMDSIRDITERKQAEDALIASETRFRSIIDASPIPMSLNDEQLRITYLNPAFTRTFGYSIQDIPTLADWWPKACPDPDYRSWVAESWQGRLEAAKQAGAEFHPMELAVRCKDGTKKFALASATSIQGCFSGEHLVLLYDITDRKQSEELILNTSRQLESVLESTKDLIAMMDREYRYTLFNKAFHTEFKRIFGVDLKTGDSMVTALSQLPNDLANGLAYWNRAFTGEDFTIEQQFGDPRLERRWYELHFSPIKDGQGNVYDAIHIVRDITERKRSEEALRRSRAELATAQAISRIGSWKVTFSHVEPQWSGSDELYTLYGYPTDMKLTMQTGIDRMHPDDRDFVNAAWADATSGKGPNEWDHRIIVNGRTKWVHVAAQVSLGPDGKPLEASGTCQDITERKRIEAEMRSLEAQNRQLQRAESLGRMAGAIAHLFNNQLQVVSGYLEIAQGELSPDASGLRPIMDKALLATKKASQVSSSMLTYLGQTVASCEPVDLSGICERAIPLLREVMPKKTVFESHLPSVRPIIHANADQIQQVLSNLVSNAWEAAADGSLTIRVSVSTVDVTSISVVHRLPVDAKVPAGLCACLEVSDTGCGIAPQDIERIFDPFFTSKFPGRGMGLAVVLGIVRAHGGVITVDSQPGRGSSFRVHFPVIEERPTRPTTQSGELRKIEAGGKILLVEDDEMVRDMAEKMLSKMGYAVLSAVDGVEAVDVFRTNAGSIRLVLCDVFMPRMDGWETLAELRKLSPGIPVILASGYSEAQVMAKAHAEKPQAFLGKPYQMDQLEKAILRALANEKL